MFTSKVGHLSFAEGLPFLNYKFPLAHAYSEPSPVLHRGLFSPIVIVLDKIWFCSFNPCPALVSLTEGRKRQASPPPLLHLAPRATPPQVAEHLPPSVPYLSLSPPDCWSPSVFQRICKAAPTLGTSALRMCRVCLFCPQSGVAILERGQPAS